MLRRFAVACCGPAGADRLLELRSLQRVDHRAVGVLEEERVREEIRLRLIHEGRDLPHQGGGVAHVPLSHRRKKRLVHVLVADAVTDEVGACFEQELGVVEVEDVDGDGEPDLMRTVDDGLLNLALHLFDRAQVVVDSELHEVNTHIDVSICNF
jgi:hypothetical protein